LLRGRKPTQAYHLDAQNPASVLVADAVELRPNDIVFVAEQPLTSFNRTLLNILPLRVLLRDIQDNNFP
jgi:polysaccharide export outer membrane protein